MREKERGKGGEKERKIIKKGKEKDDREREKNIMRETEKKD